MKERGEGEIGGINSKERTREKRLKKEGEKGRNYLAEREAENLIRDVIRSARTNLSCV